MSLTPRFGSGLTKEPSGYWKSTTHPPRPFSADVGVLLPTRRSRRHQVVPRQLVASKGIAGARRRKLDYVGKDSRGGPVDAPYRLVSRTEHSADRSGEQRGRRRKRVVTQRPNS